MGMWTLFSNHGHVLICLVKDPATRLRDVAEEVGITERAVQKIVRDLQDAGMVSVVKDGRRNTYRIDRTMPLRHALEAHCTVADLIAFVGVEDGANVQAGPAPKKSRAAPKPASPAHAASVQTAQPTREPALVPAAVTPRGPEPEPVLKPTAVTSPGLEPEPAPQPVAVTSPGPEPEPAPQPAKRQEPALTPAKRSARKKKETDNDIERQQGTLF